MNEGVYRILSALSDGRTHARSAVVRDAGEAQSVLLALEKDKPRWFDAHGAELRLSEKGRKAHAFEQRARTPALSEAELVDALRARLDGRERERAALPGFAVGIAISRAAQHYDGRPLRSGVVRGGRQPIRERQREELPRKQ